MKILTIGDLHGREVWRDIIKKHGKDVDKIVFVGDYFDSFTESVAIQIYNFKEIIKLKKQEPDKYVLLWGNHDIHYKQYNIPRGSGYNHSYANQIHALIINNINYLQLAYQYKNYIWTHAGIHKGWYIKFISELRAFNPDWLNLELGAQLNNAVKSKLIGTIYYIGHARGGQYNVGGPLWVDKSRMWRKMLEGYHQIVGHTQQKEISKSVINDNTSTTFIDTGNDKAFLLTNIE